MKETDSNKIKREAEFTLKHTLTQSDFQKMIAEKLARARAYDNALRNRKTHEATRV